MNALDAPKPKKTARPKRRLKAAISACRDAGLLVREARIGPDGEVRIIIGSRTDPDTSRDPCFKHAPIDPNRN